MMNKSSYPDIVKAEPPSQLDNIGLQIPGNSGEVIPLAGKLSEVLKEGAPHMLTSNHDVS